MVAIEADMCAGVGESSMLETKTSHWNNLIAEFADVFEPPGMPAEYETMHRIKLQPGAVPLFRPSYNLYKAPIVFIHKTTCELCMTVDYRT